MTSEARAALREKVARAMEETLQPECCGAYLHGANGEPECCMSPEYKWPPIEDIADAAIAVIMEEAARVVTEHYQELCTEHRMLLLNRAAALRAYVSPPESAAPHEDQ
jgi:hypothetical protein